MLFNEHERHLYQVPKQLNKKNQNNKSDLNKYEKIINSVKSKNNCTSGKNQISKNKLFEELRNDTFENKLITRSNLEMMPDQFKQIDKNEDIDDSLKEGRLFKNRQEFVKH